MNTLKQSIWVLILLAVVGCRKKDDSNPPVIEYLKVNGVESQSHNLEAGSTIEVEMRLVDDVELNQVKVNIHPADDGHTHEGGGGVGEVTTGNVGVWTDNRIINLAGKSVDQALTYSVPISISGHWHIEVLLIDEQGNEAEEYVTTLYVENANLPTITLTTDPVVEGNEVGLVPGGVLTVTALIEDEDGVGEVHIEVEYPDGALFALFNFDGAGETAFTAGPQAITFTNAGHYHLHVEATDGNGMSNMSELHIHVE